MKRDRCVWHIETARMSDVETTVPTIIREFWLRIFYCVIQLLSSHTCIPDDQMLNYSEPFVADVINSEVFLLFWNENSTENGWRYMHGADRTRFYSSEHSTHECNTRIIFYSALMDFRRSHICRKLYFSDQCCLKLIDGVNIVPKWHFCSCITILYKLGYFSLHCINNGK